MRNLLLWLRRQWLLVLVLVAFLVLVITQLGEIQRLLATLRHGQEHWVAATAGLQVVYFLLYALLYQSAFLTVGIRTGLLELLPVLLASIFVNTVVPSGGLGGAALFVARAERHGQPGARATEGVLLVAVIENAAVFLVLLIGLGDLVAHHALQPYQLLGVAVYLLIVGGLTAVLFLGRWRPGTLLDILRRLQEVVDTVASGLRHGPVLAPDWAARTAGGFVAAANAIAGQPRLIRRTVATGLALEAANLASLYTAFLAFQEPLRVGTLCAGYALGYVFSIVSFLPLDNGLMQGVMILVYGSLGVTTAAALAAVLVWGGLNSWLPLAIGALFLRQLAATNGSRRP